MSQTPDEIYICPKCRENQRTGAVPTNNNNNNNTTTTPSSSSKSKKSAKGTPSGTPSVPSTPIDTTSVFEKTPSSGNKKDSKKKQTDSSSKSKSKSKPKSNNNNNNNVST